MSPSRASLTFVVVFLTLASESVRADVSTEVDCLLVHSDLSCSELLGTFESSLPSVDEDTEQHAVSINTVQIALRDIEDTVGRRYVATFSGQPPGSHEATELRLSVEVPHAAGHDRTLALVVAMLHRGLVPFLHVEAPGVSEGGELLLRASRSGDATSADDSVPTPWYARPSLSGEYARVGLTSATIRAALEVNYSTPAIRWRFAGKAEYRFLDFSVGDTTLRGSVVNVDASSRVARSLGTHLSLGVLGGIERSPANNLEWRGRASAGLEILRAPFLETNESNVGARLEMSAFYAQLASPNGSTSMRPFYTEPSIEVFGLFHSRSVDVEVGMSAAFVTHLPEFWRVNGEGSITVRLTERLSLSLEGGLQYLGGAINQPLDPNALDPVAVALGGNTLTQITVTTGLSLAWALGNPLLRSQDQRWR